MSRKKRNKINDEHIIRYESNNISEEKMIEIQSEAYYRALKRIEEEKANIDKKGTVEHRRYKWYEHVWILLNILFFPWKINNKRFKINNKFYDNILVVIISWAMETIGFIIWFVSIYMILYSIYVGVKDGKIIIIPVVAIFSISFTMLGSYLIVSGKQFSKETDSNRIYAYSSSIIALVSCIVAIIALVISIT